MLQIIALRFAKLFLFNYGTGLTRAFFIENDFEQGE